jgi:Bifunctional DNA primase/polymerase, N-terminal
VTLTLHKMGRIHQDLEYIKSFNGHRAPCNVTFDSKKGKYSKVPAVARWTEITPESAAKLEAEGWDGHKHFIFLTGEETEQLVIDIDRKNPDREDHEDNVDGLEFYEDWCGHVSTPDTFTSRTIGGGYHKVYKMCDELRDSIKSGKLKPRVLVDVLYNNRGFVYASRCNAGL